MVREAAARVQCMNNLKQIALAVHDYSKIEGRLPMGTADQASLAPEQRLSWSVAILPYIEQDNLFRRIDQGSPWESAANQDAVGSPVGGFRCPALVVAKSDKGSNATNYIGIAGVGVDA